MAVRLLSMAAKSRPHLVGFLVGKKWRKQQPSLPKEGLNDVKCVLLCGFLVGKMGKNNDQENQVQGYPLRN